MLKTFSRILVVCVLIIAITSTTVLLTGCSDSLENKLTAHEWVRTHGSDRYVYTFFENGTFQMIRSYTSGMQKGSDNGTWEINGTELVISSFKEPFTFKDVNENEASEDSLGTDEWYVSDKYLYFYGNEYIAQN